MTSTLPSQHVTFIEKAREFFSNDHRFEALLGGGSLVHGGFDEHSDLDLVIIVKEEFYPEVMESRRALAESVDVLVSAFTGEHVGEPRLLICLYQNALLHVDMKFVTVSDLDARIEIPAVLWARNMDLIQQKLDAAIIEWPNQSPQWFEDRAWIWLHYAITKAMRCEFYEAIGMLSFFRDQVLGPMIHRRHGQNQRGVRRIEEIGGAMLAATVPACCAKSVRSAIHASMELYLELREDQVPEKITNGMPEGLCDLYPLHAV
ncbi:MULTISPECIES: nucleotidyltransferase domain-containing protein [Kordiimonas]|jgi:predicted nucleotidyltransferase|uniref:nucleotidyltransferase domain-containing protein n=1 Tax=Kordiimonas TaxID=288021 RepID=UPI00257ABF10|nr:nucleotidyltransferase domain-containing protein [Kordiimonas sp. UBA4487]